VVQKDSENGRDIGDRIQLLHPAFGQ